MKWSACCCKKPTIDMIPILDTIFILLIFFMLSFNVSGLKTAIPLNLASSNTSVQEMKKNDYTLSIDALGQYYIDNQKVTYLELKQKIKALRDLNPTIYLSIEKNVSFSKIVEVLDFLREANLKNIAFETKIKDQES